MPLSDHYKSRGSDCSGHTIIYSLWWWTVMNSVLWRHHLTSCMLSPEASSLHVCTFVSLTQKKEWSWRSRHFLWQKEVISLCVAGSALVKQWQLTSSTVDVFLDLEIKSTPSPTCSSLMRVSTGVLLIWVDHLLIATWGSEVRTLTSFAVIINWASFVFF